MPDTWELASAFARFLIYFGVLASSGLVLVRIVFRHETGGLHRPLVGQTTMLAVLALLASGIGFALKGAAMTGEASGMTDPEMLGLVWQTPVGTALVFRVVGLALVLAGIRIPGIGLPVAVAGGILALVVFPGWACRGRGAGLVRSPPVLASRRRRLLDRRGRLPARDRSGQQAPFRSGHEERRPDGGCRSAPLHRRGVGRGRFHPHGDGRAHHGAGLAVRR